jgi:16S rRNA processing protein RimM
VARSDLVVLGVVTRPHGIRGEVRVHRFNPESTLLCELGRATLRGKDGAERDVKILRAKRAGDADVLAIEGVASKEAAEALRGSEIGVAKHALPRLPEGELYHSDLVGLRATVEGRDIGEVIGVETYPSSVAMRVRTDRGTIEVPVLEPYVVRLDPGARTIELAHLDDFDPVE